MIQFELISPEKVLLSEEIYEAILPAAGGQIAVLPNHVPLITLLKPGVISIRRKKGDDDAKLDHIATSGGFVEIGQNRIKVMADTAERADDLDEMKIEQAKEEAKRQAYAAKDDVSHASALARLEMELARYKVKNLKKHRGSRENIFNQQP